MVMLSQQENPEVWIELKMGCVVEQDGSPVDGKAGQRYKVRKLDANYLSAFHRAFEVDGPHRKVAAK